MGRNLLHSGLARSHETGVIRTQRIEVSAERHRFQFQFFQGTGDRFQILFGRSEEEAHLHPLEARAGNRLGPLPEFRD